MTRIRWTEPRPHPDDRRFRWRVTGTEERLGGNMTWPWECEGVTSAEHLPEALMLLLNRDLAWDGLDTEATVTIEIEPWPVIPGLTDAEDEVAATQEP